MTTNAQHTPGPWDWDGAIRPSGNGSFYLYVVAHGKKLCAVWGPNENREANARLMARAPDMLAALKMIAARIDEASGVPTFTADEHDDLEKLIAEAEGRP